MDTQFTNERHEDYILFFKLYWLNHSANWLEYMADTKLLKAWIVDHEFEPEKYWFEKQSLMHSVRTISPTFCGNCFSRVSSKGGSFTFSCERCMGGENRGYELYKLSEIVKIPWIDTMVFATNALDQLMKDSNNVDIMQGILTKRY